MINPKGHRLSNSQMSEILTNTPEVYDDGFLRIEHDKYYVSCEQEILRLGRAEFLIVSILARNANRFLKGKDIWQYVWQNERPFNQESLKVIIYHLRRSLSPFGIKIETMNRIGYKLVPYVKRGD